jgi:hypothetical protein
MFDLNRDWAWLTQVESQQRLKLYNQWMPHVHVDFHEQGVNNPYYFAPAAEPYHEVITDFQREFQVTIGKNHAKYFDANGWFYFTKEVFDLLYPSYGDTYPVYNGAIGMTYEQGGSGRAGLGVLTEIGDTLTLKDRIDHHFTTGISTIEVATKNIGKLNEEFKKFHQNRNFKNKNYVVKGNSDNLELLAQLLKKHEIKFGKSQNNTVKGQLYSTGKLGTFSITDEALVIPTNQPKGTLAKVLFEPNTKLSDSLTYDITAWSLPYAYGLDAVATTQSLNLSKSDDSAVKEYTLKDAYAFVGDWNSMKDAQFLAEALREGIRIRKSNEPFQLQGKNYARGTLIITKSDNKNFPDFLNTLERLSKKHAKDLTPVATGFVDQGKDFGSDQVQMIKAPKIAVLSGEPTSTLRFGEIWHFFEQQLNYPVTVLDFMYLEYIDFNEYDILIVPDGSFSGGLPEKLQGKLKPFVEQGGKLIAMGKALGALASESGFSIKKNEFDPPEKSKTEAHISRERRNIKNAITGAIFKTKVDNTHPLAFGYNNTYHTLKLGADSYRFLDYGNVVILEENTTPIGGFAGSLAQEKIKNSLVFGTENIGWGQVIYMADNPLFRGFWQNGKLFFANALFMVN